MEAELTAKKTIEHLEDTIGKQVKTKERERDKKIDVEAEQVKQTLAKVDAEIESVRETNLVRKSEINMQKDKELLQKGADTQRLNAIDAQLTRIGDELDFIDHNRDTVANYRRDKQEYIDKVDEFKAQKGIAENQLAQEEQKYIREKGKMGKELGIVRETIDSLNKTLRNIEEDKDEFGNFRETVLYDAVNEHFTNPLSSDKNEKRAKIIIDEIKETEYGKLAARMGELRTVTIEFVSKFSDDNIFKFKKQHIGFP